MSTRNDMDPFGLGPLPPAEPPDEDAEPEPEAQEPPERRITFV